MSPHQIELFERIQSFEIDGTEPVALPFAGRLARENGWSRAYAERVIGEYKRYMFLAACSRRPGLPVRGCRCRLALTPHVYPELLEAIFASKCLVRPFTTIPLAVVRLESREAFPNV